MAANFLFILCYNYFENTETKFDNLDVFQFYKM